MVAPAVFVCAGFGGRTNAEPVYRFAGHSHPDFEFTHKYMLEKLGAEGMFALRKSGFDMLQRVLGAMRHPSQFPDLILDEQKLLEDIAEEFPDKQEIVKYLVLHNMLGAYSFDKGWLPAMQHFADCIIGNRPMHGATATDGLAASCVGHAAIESRASGNVVALRSPQPKRVPAGVS